MISVVTPTYNRKEMLLGVINSVQKQSYTDFEIIIVDDCSTDGTFEMMQQFATDDRIRYYRNVQNKGPGFNRNFGFRQARGEYIVFMDDDDYYINFDFFQKAIQVFEENKNLKIAFVAGNAYNEYVKTLKREETDVGCIGYINGIDFLMNIEIKYHKPISTFPTVFNAAILKEANLEHMKMVNDYAIYLRALLYGGVFIIPDFVGVYRKHDNNISSHIERDFLIDNLEERVWVKCQLDGRVERRKVNKWWYIQMRILLSYYLFDTRPSIHDGICVSWWIIKNSGFAPQLWWMLAVRIVKIRIKLLLKKNKLRN